MSLRIAERSTWSADGLGWLEAWTNLMSVKIERKSILSKNKIIVIDNDDGHSKAILQEDLDKRGCWRCVDDARWRGGERLDRWCWTWWTWWTWTWWCQSPQQQPHWRVWTRGVVDDWVGGEPQEEQLVQLGRNNSSETAVSCPTRLSSISSFQEQRNIG